MRQTAFLFRAGSSVGRASALQAEGHRFKPCSAYHGGVVQFWLERRPVTPEVASSSLVAPAIFIKVRHQVKIEKFNSGRTSRLERSACPSGKVASSSLVAPATIIIRSVASYHVTGLFYFMAYYLYIIQSDKDDSFYIGTTQNLDGRIFRHNQGRSKYTKSKRPWNLVYFEEHADRSDAMKREYAIKRRKSKEYLAKLIKRFNSGQKIQLGQAGRSRVRVSSLPPFFIRPVNM